jgi:hypothetical protein
MSDKKTVGQISLDLQQKAPEERSVVELERAMHSDYEQKLLETLEEGKKTLTGDFFVIVLTKKERLLNNVLRNYFFFRNSCPTPDYDQAVYQYLKADDKIKFLWVIPSKDTCMLLLENRQQIAPSEYELLSFVLKFADGTLGALMKKLNGEPIV